MVVSNKFEKDKEESACIIIQEVERRLQSFLPTFLEVKRCPHPQHPDRAASSAIHLTIRIQSSKLSGCRLVEAHRLVYQILDDMIPDKIHSLSIKVSRFSF